jgi:hypothetical protein
LHERTEAEFLQSFRTRVIFAKSKVGDMKSRAFEELCAALNIPKQTDKLKQINDLIDSIARPENMGLSRRTSKYLLTLSTIAIPITRTEARSREKARLANAIEKKARLKDANGADDHNSTLDRT